MMKLDLNAGFVSWVGRVGEEDALILRILRDAGAVFHARTKLIELDHHFVREKVLDGIIDMIAVRSEDNIADIFTKSLPKGPFEDLRSKLGLIQRTSL